MYIKTNSKKKIWEYVQLKGHKEKQYADTNQMQVNQNKLPAFTRNLKTDTEQLLVKCKMNPKKLDQRDRITVNFFVQV